MPVEITPEIQQQLLAARNEQCPAEQAFASMEVAVSQYLNFVWDDFLRGGTTPEDLYRAIGFVTSSGETGEALWRLPHDGHALHLKTVRELAQLEVPLAVEFGVFLAKRARRDKGSIKHLQHLMEQIHEATAEDVDGVLAEIADVLQNHLLLRVGERQYRITELEMYYRRGRTHDDGYVHGRDEQLEMGRWFFNDADALDLTFGDRSKPAWGGILLRGLQRLPLRSLFQHVAPNEQSYVRGPRNVLRDIIAHLNGVFTTLPGLQLEELPAAATTATAPWRVRRFGLRPKKDDEDQMFLNRPYRFIVDADYLKGLKDRADVVRQLGWPAAQAQPILGYRPAVG